MVNNWTGSFRWEIFATFDTMEGCILDNSEPPNTGSACAGVLLTPGEGFHSLNWWLANLSLCVACFCRYYFIRIQLDSFFHLLSGCFHTQQRWLVAICQWSTKSNIFPLWPFTESLLAPGPYRPVTKLIFCPPRQGLQLLHLCALGLGVSIQSSPRTENRLQNHTKY